MSDSKDNKRKLNEDANDATKDNKEVHISMPTIKKASLSKTA